MIGWLDASNGASGDMLLAACLEAGADETAVRAAIDAVAPEKEAVTLRLEPVLRGSLAALRAHVSVPDSTTHRGLKEVLQLIDAAELTDDVSMPARSVFTRLAEAEAAVHAVGVDEVQFHEVGALDAIADVVGVCAALVSMGLDELQCSPVAVGSGSVSTSHGTLSVPPPAVARLLRGVPSFAGPVSSELCTPTGAALLAHWVTSWGAQPLMTTSAVGTGAGERDFAGHANVVRLFVGERYDVAVDALAPHPASDANTQQAAIVYEANIDDLDPRLWPHVLDSLLAHGASDAWLTPILMKKGRPAQTLSVLVAQDQAAVVRGEIFAQTSTIGLRETRVGKVALDREERMVQVDGHDISVKLARLDGQVVNVQPEYDRVVVAAAQLGRPVKVVLAQAVAAAVDGWTVGDSPGAEAVTDR
ncbi:MAG: nickel pincer cofactor biosynthesis protein LarC [Nocardioidaceae bacterium]